MPKVEQPYYLKKSIKIFTFYGIGLLISLLSITLLRSVNENFKIVYKVLVVILYLITLVLSPLEYITIGEPIKVKKSPEKSRQCS